MNQQKFEYKEPFDENRWKGCASGIHFFMTREAIQACGDYGYTQLTTGYMSEESQKARREYLMEVFDIIHATETLLRMEATDEEVEQLQQAVIEKNRKRGYYDALHQSV